MNTSAGWLRDTKQGVQETAFEFYSVCQANKVSLPNDLVAKINERIVSQMKNVNHMLTQNEVKQREKFRLQTKAGSSWYEFIQRDFDDAEGGAVRDVLKLRKNLIVMLRYVEQGVMFGSLELQRKLLGEQEKGDPSSSLIYQLLDLLRFKHPDIITAILQALDLAIHGPLAAELVRILRFEGNHWGQVMRNLFDVYAFDTTNPEIYRLVTKVALSFMQVNVNDEEQAENTFISVATFRKMTIHNMVTRNHLIDLSMPTVSLYH